MCSEQKGLCSMFLMEIEGDRRAFRYDVQINASHQGTQKKLTRRGADDAQRCILRRMCHLLLKMAIEKRWPFLEGKYVFDCNRTLFTPMELELEGKNEVILGCDEVDEFVRANSHPDCREFGVSISPNLQKPILDISDLRGEGEENRSLRTFLELTTSQFALNRGFYTPFGTGKLYENEGRLNVEMGNSQEIELRNGISKGIRLVENFGTPAMTVVLDTRISPFYAQMDLVKFLKSMLGRGKLPQQMGEWPKLERKLADLRVQVKYAPHRSFGIGRFSAKPLAELSATFEGKRIALKEYFEGHKGIRLQHLNLPAIISNIPQPKGKPMEAFPMEELAVMGGQRVPMEKMSRELEQKLVQMNTIPPEERLEAILKQADKLGLFDRKKNSVLGAFGIRILRHSNQALFSVRPAPRLRYGNGVLLAPNQNRAEWRQSSSTQKYLATGKIGKWAVICDQRYVIIAKTFIRTFLAAARLKGMKFGGQNPPVPIPFLSGPDGIGFAKHFEKCAAEKVEFVLLFDNKKEKSHGLLKLMEAENKVLTQHITLESVSDVVLHQKTQTLDNIIAKTNCKNFGLNYAPNLGGGQNGQLAQMEEGKLLVIGYDVAHPAALTPNERRMLWAKGMNDLEALEPSVVGICANMAMHPHNFVGDYFFQQSRKESVNVAELEDRMGWILGNLAKNRPKHRCPANILILRDGLSEGQFRMAIDEELTALREGCRQFGAKNGIENYKPNFTFVVGTKRHFKRFFAGEIPEKVRNLVPGSVVEKKFTRPDLAAEFFLQPHFSAKGTSKSVQYSVLANEAGIGVVELQDLLNALCHTHQIVPSATSLPEPIFQADELAKRGRENFLALKHFRPERIPRLGGFLVDMGALTALLSYRNHPLGICTRFTA